MVSLFHPGDFSDETQLAFALGVTPCALSQVRLHVLSKSISKSQIKGRKQKRERSSMWPHWEDGLVRWVWGWEVHGISLSPKLNNSLTSKETNNLL